MVHLEEIKEACQDDLHFLCTQMLGYKDWQSPLHDDLEVFLAKPASRKALLIPRNHLKTSLVTIGKTIQYVLKNPNVRVLLANQVWDISRKMLSEIKEHLSDKSQLPKLFGDFRSDFWNQDAITIRQRTKAFKEPTISTTGVEAEQTGGHYDVIFLDDLTGLQNCQTPEQREKVKRFRRSMINLLEPGGTLIEVGTRWHLDDAFSEIFEKESEYYDIMIRKVIEDGKIIFPMKFNKKFDHHKKIWLPSEEPTMDFIDHLKKSMTPAEFAAQYMNNPIDEENQLFRSSYFKYYTKRPEHLYVAMTIDPAISEQRQADYSAIVVCGMDAKYDIYVLDSLRGRWNVSQLIQNIFDMNSKWKPSAVGLEVIAFQKALKAWLEERMRQTGDYFPITELKRNTHETKEYRIKALEPFYREGKIYHASTMSRGDLESELLTFPKGKHDDLIDAFSGQLDLLVPGDDAISQEMIPGSWEDELSKVVKANRPWEGFFKETLNG